jgi:hypothetical protein
MTDYLACHFERIARNLSSLYGAIHSNRTTTLQILTLLDSVKKYKALRQCSGQTARAVAEISLRQTHQPRRVD